MNERPRDNKGKDFVAPDESQRVVDPEKAKAMAEYSDKSRTKAAGFRKAAASDEAEGKGANLIEISRAYSKAYDEKAGDQEDAAAGHYDALKMKPEFEKLSSEELEAESKRIYREMNRLSQLNEQLHSVIRERKSSGA